MGLKDASQDGWQWQAMAASCGLATYAKYRSGQRSGVDTDSRMGLLDLAIAQKQAELEAAIAGGRAAIPAPRPLPPPAMMSAPVRRVGHALTAPRCAQSTAGPSKDSADLAHLLELAEQKREVLIDCHRDQVCVHTHGGGGRTGGLRGWARSCPQLLQLPAAARRAHSVSVAAGL